MLHNSPERVQLGTIEFRKPGTWMQGSITVICSLGHRVGYPYNSEVIFIPDSDSPQTTVEVTRHGYGQSPENTLTVRGKPDDVDKIKQEYHSGSAKTLT